MTYTTSSSTQTCSNAPFAPKMPSMILATTSVVTVLSIDRSTMPIPVPYRNTVNGKKRHHNSHACARALAWPNQESRCTSWEKDCWCACCNSRLASKHGQYDSKPSKRDTHALSQPNRVRKSTKYPRGRNLPDSVTGHYCGVRYPARICCTTTATRCRPTLFFLFTSRLYVLLSVVLAVSAACIWLRSRQRWRWSCRFCIAGVVTNESRHQQVMVRLLRVGLKSDDVIVKRMPRISRENRNQHTIARARCRRQPPPPPPPPSYCLLCLWSTDRWFC